MDYLRNGLTDIPLQTTVVHIYIAPLYHLTSHKVLITGIGVSRGLITLLTLH
jgi:hypothetical protein